MRLPVLSPRPLAIISSSANSVPSKNNTSALAMRASRSSVTWAQAGRIDEPLARGLHRDADRSLADLVGADVPLLEPQRNLAGNREQFELDARQRLEWLAKADRAARRDGAVDDVEHAIGADRVQRRLRGEDDERLALAQRQKAGRGIDLGVGQDDGADRRMAPLALWVQRRRRQDLLAQVDRGVEQEPVCAVDGEREARLGARLDTAVAAPGEAADRGSRSSTAARRRRRPSRARAPLGARLAGDIVEARRDAGGAAGRRGEARPFTSERAAASRSRSPDERVMANEVTAPDGPIAKETPTIPLAPRARAAAG